MTATFRSHVLRREEKGLFGMPFKRLLLSGVCGGMGYTVTAFFAPALGIGAALIGTLLTLILTGERGGLPLWQRLYYRLRGRLLTGALRTPDGWQAHLVQLMGWSAAGLVIESAVMFSAPQGDDSETDWREWVTFARPDEREGLAFVDAPLEGVADGR